MHEPWTPRTDVMRAYICPPTQRLKPKDLVPYICAIMFQSMTASASKPESPYERKHDKNKQSAMLISTLTPPTNFGHTPNKSSEFLVFLVLAVFSIAHLWLTGKLFGWNAQRCLVTCFGVVAKSCLLTSPMGIAPFSCPWPHMSCFLQLPEADFVSATHIKPIQGFL